MLCPYKCYKMLDRCARHENCPKFSLFSFIPIDHKDRTKSTTTIPENEQRIETYNLELVEAD